MNGQEFDQTVKEFKIRRRKRLHDLGEINFGYCNCYHCYKRVEDFKHARKKRRPRRNWKRIKRHQWE